MDNIVSDGRDEEHGIVRRLYTHIDDVLHSGGHTARETIRGLNAVLPDAVQYTPHQLRKLVSLHTNSAQDLMTALRLMAPAAFGSADTDYADMAALDPDDSELMSLVSALIELQLFHLRRAGQLLALVKQQLALQVAAQVGQLVQASQQQQESGTSTCPSHHFNNDAQPLADAPEVGDL